jgi:hypothetical protein
MECPDGFVTAVGAGLQEARLVRPHAATVSFNGRYARSSSRAKGGTRRAFGRCAQGGTFGGNHVRTIKLRLTAGGLSRKMAEMREWLDSNGYEPSRFSCDQEQDIVVVSVDFMSDAAAEAFARRFYGDTGPLSSSPLGQLAVVAA